MLKFVIEPMDGSRARLRKVSFVISVSGWVSSLKGTTRMARSDMAAWGRAMKAAVPAMSRINIRDACQSRVQASVRVRGSVPEDDFPGTGGRRQGAERFK